MEPCLTRAITSTLQDIKVKLHHFALKDFNWEKLARTSQLTSFVDVTLLDYSRVTVISQPYTLQQARQKTVKINLGHSTLYESLCSMLNVCFIKINSLADSDVK